MLKGPKPHWREMLERQLDSLRMLVPDRFEHAKNLTKDSDRRSSDRRGMDLIYQPVPGT